MKKENIKIKEKEIKRKDKKRNIIEVKQISIIENQMKAEKEIREIFIKYNFSYAESLGILEIIKEIIKREIWE